LQVLCAIWQACIFNVKLSLIAHLPEVSEKLRDHFEGLNTVPVKKYHLEAVQQAEAFKSVMESKQVAIDQQMSKVQAITIARNWKKLKSIVETVIFCGRQGLHCMAFVMTLHVKKLHHMPILAIS